MDQYELAAVHAAGKSTSVDAVVPSATEDPERRPASPEKRLAMRKVSSVDDMECI